MESDFVVRIDDLARGLLFYRESFQFQGFYRLKGINCTYSEYVQFQ